MEAAGGRRVRIMGVDVLDLTLTDAVALLAGHLDGPPAPARSVCFVNAHTLNVAAADPRYRAELGRADYVFGDGTGVRWASRIIHGAQLQDNVNGTDLVPALFAATAGRGHRVYLLGGTESAVERAAARAAALHRGWTVCGHHHGYLDDQASAEVVARVNAARPDLLLVGMGNPLQERWIDRHRAKLQARLCIAVGGLFSYWTGEIQRAPEWVRRLGHEWAHILALQPHKAGRYLLGNPLFLARAAGTRIFGEGFLQRR